MRDPLIGLELRLLLLRHGRGAVLEALANVGDQTVEDLEREIAEVASKKAKRKPRQTSTASLIAKVFHDRPELIPVVERLVMHYENKTVLPQLRDVQRLLTRLGATQGRLRSRSTALPRLVRALAEMDADEIERLSQPEDGSSDSDYALLAREIMGGSMPNRAQRIIGGRKTDN